MRKRRRAFGVVPYICIYRLTARACRERPWRRAGAADPSRSGGRVWRSPGARGLCRSKAPSRSVCSAGVAAHGVGEPVVAEGDQGEPCQTRPPHAVAPGGGGSWPPGSLSCGGSPRERPTPGLPSIAPGYGSANPLGGGGADMTSADLTKCKYKVRPSGTGAWPTPWRSPSSGWWTERSAPRRLSSVSTPGYGWCRWRASA